MSARLTENHMLYFPTSEPWTHMVQPPRMVYPQAPSVANANTPPAGSRRATFQQSTLQFSATQQCPQADVQPASQPSPAHRSPATSTNGTLLGPMHRWVEKTVDDSPPLATIP